MASSSDPHELEGVRARSHKSIFPLTALFFALIALILGLLILTPYPEKIRRKLGLSVEKKVPPKIETKIVYEERIVEKIVVPKASYYQLKDGTDVGRTSSGFDFKSSVVLEKGGLASRERLTPGSYAANYTLDITLPKPAVSVEDVR